MRSVNFFYCKMIVFVYETITARTATIICIIALFVLEYFSSSNTRSVVRKNLCYRTSRTSSKISLLIFGWDKVSHNWPLKSLAVTILYAWMDIRLRFIFIQRIFSTFFTIAHRFILETWIVGAFLWKNFRQHQAQKLCIWSIYDQIFCMYNFRSTQLNWNFTCNILHQLRGVKTWF